MNTFQGFAIAMIIVSLILSGVSYYYYNKGDAKMFEVFSLSATIVVGWNISNLFTMVWHDHHPNSTVIFLWLTLICGVIALIFVGIAQYFAHNNDHDTADKFNYLASLFGGVGVGALAGWVWVTTSNPTPVYAYAPNMPDDQQFPLNYR
jgi:H+/Cl- antiporter ClcA